MVIPSSELGVKDVSIDVTVFMGLHQLENGTPFIPVFFFDIVTLELVALRIVPNRFRQVG